MQAAREPVDATTGDGLGTPGDTTTTLEDTADELVRFELLQKVVHGKGRISVIQANDEADRHLVIAHRVHPRPAVFAVLGPEAQRPSKRVNQLVEGIRNFPHLFDAKLPNLGGVAVKLPVLARHLSKVALCSLSKDGDLRANLNARLKRGLLLALASASLVAGQDALDTTIVDQQLLGVSLWKEIRAKLLGLLGHEARELADGDDPVAVIFHLRRRRKAERPALGQHVDRFLLDDALNWQVSDAEFGEEVLQRLRADDRAGEQVGSRALPLLHDRHRNLAEGLRECRVLREQLAEADRTGESRRTGTDEQHAHVNAFVLTGGRRHDIVGRAESGWVILRKDAHCSGLRRTVCVSTESIRGIS